MNHVAYADVRSAAGVVARREASAPSRYQAVMDLYETTRAAGETLLTDIKVTQPENS